MSRKTARTWSYTVIYAYLLSVARVVPRGLGPESQHISGLGLYVFGSRFILFWVRGWVYPFLGPGLHLTFSGSGVGSNLFWVRGRVYPFLGPGLGLSFFGSGSKGLAILGLGRRKTVTVRCLVLTLLLGDVPLTLVVHSLSSC
jgi:hypothetical protein